jgi:hypothetical protein
MLISVSWEMTLVRRKICHAPPIYQLQIGQETGRENDGDKRFCGMPQEKRRSTAIRARAKDAANQTARRSRN